MSSRGQQAMDRIKRYTKNLLATVGFVSLAATFAGPAITLYKGYRNAQEPEKTLPKLKMAANFFHDLYRPGEDDSKYLGGDDPRTYIQYFKDFQDEFQRKDRARQEFLTRVLYELDVKPAATEMAADRIGRGARDAALDAGGSGSSGGSNAWLSASQSAGRLWNPGSALLMTRDDGQLVAIDAYFREFHPGEHGRPLSLEGDEAAVEGARGHDAKTNHDDAMSDWVPVRLSVQRVERVGKPIFEAEAALPHGLMFRHFRRLVSAGGGWARGPSSSSSSSSSAAALSPPSSSSDLF